MNRRIDRPRRERAASGIWAGSLTLAAVVLASAAVGARQPDTAQHALGYTDKPPSADHEEARRQALESRAALRAYEGAPPVIPHPADGLSVQTCRACHAEGLRAGRQTASMASHVHLVNCMQCHAEGESHAFPGSAHPDNSFVGLRPAGEGGMRAWEGAPPTIPHTTFMRTNCISCHGPHGPEGLRTDHPERISCVQCHAPAASLEQLSPAFDRELLRAFAPPGE